MSIPRRIIQTGILGAIPAKERACMEAMRLLHPEWEFIFFDDDAVDTFMAGQPREYQQAFLSFPKPIQRFDFFRCLAVHQLGGFYFDLDVLIGKRLDPLTTLDCVLSFEELTMCEHLRNIGQTDWQIGNYAFGAEKGHPFINKVIEICLRTAVDKTWREKILSPIPSWIRNRYEAPYTTGPGAFSHASVELSHNINNVAILFPNDVTNISEWHSFGEFGVHLMNGSWRPKLNAIHNRIERLWEQRHFKRLYAESIKLGKKRTSRFFHIYPEGSFLHSPPETEFSPT